MTTRTITATILLVLAAVLLAGCDKITKAPNNPCAMDNATQKAQAEANLKNVELQIEVQKRLTTIQMKVIDQCVTQGGTPIIGNGNVDCKAKPGGK